MLPSLIRLAVLFAVAMGSSVLWGADEADIELPGDPSAVVITMEHVGGLRPLPRIELGPDGRAVAAEVEKPALEIKADGTVVRNGKVAKKLSADELQKLLKFITVENKFFQFDMDAVNAAVQEKQDAFRKQQQEQAKQGKSQEVREVVLDGATTMITVRLGGQEKTAGMYGVGEYSQWYGDAIQPLRQLQAIQNKLNSL